MKRAPETSYSLERSGGDADRVVSAAGSAGEGSGESERTPEEQYKKLKEDLRRIEAEVRELEQAYLASDALSERHGSSVASGYDGLLQPLLGGAAAGGSGDGSNTQSSSRKSHSHGRSHSSHGGSGSNVPTWHRVFSLSSVTSDDSNTFRKSTASSTEDREATEEASLALYRKMLAAHAKRSRGNREQENSSAASSSSSSSASTRTVHVAPVSPVRRTQHRTIISSVKNTPQY